MNPLSIKSFFSVLFLLYGTFHLYSCGSKDESIIWPEARNGHAAAFNTAQNELLIFGGSLANGEDNTLWSFRENRWAVLSNAGPSKREDALLVYHSRNQKTYLIGGRSLSTNQNFSDFWEWNGSAWNLISNSLPFGSLIHACATYDVKNDRILVFGGLSGNTLSSDLWSWNGTSWAKQNITGPAGRLAASLLYSAADEKVYLFGGSLSNGTVFKEVWELHQNTWIKRNESHPNILSNAYGVAAMGSQFILFGGFKDGRQASSEAWMFNASSNSWSLSNTSAPSARALHTLVYDPSHTSVWLFGGGAAGTLTDELWTFQNNTWTQIAKE